MSSRTLPRGSPNRPKIDQNWQEGSRERQKWLPGPFQAAAPILAAFWDWSWEGQCGRNIANTVSNSHGAGGKKVAFGITFGVCFGVFRTPLGLLLDISGAKSRKMGDPKGDPKMVGKLWISYSYMPSNPFIITKIRK